MQRIRNFCIIAHIDHGKSTLADRMLEITGTIDARNMHDQLLDSMELERERGITIKLQPVQMSWRGTTLNLIDTPGHIDFNYEVSRSLAAVEGAILLVDATQGIEAQTLANLQLAKEQRLSIIPVINKIDLPAADIQTVTRDLVNILGCAPENILKISAKTGEGVSLLLDAILDKIPPPLSDSNDMTLRALIFDAEYNEFKGVVIYSRIFSGSARQGDKIRFVRSGTTAEVIEVGYFKPDLQPTQVLSNGTIGYLITNIKELEKTRVGDTITLSSHTIDPLPGYRAVEPMVYAGVHPSNGEDYPKLKKAIYKLKLNDASMTVTPDHSETMGFGFRCGFLGLLHLEIVQERLEREFSLQVTITSPTVAYRLFLLSGEEKIITSPADYPDPSHIRSIEQPMVAVKLITPQSYMGVLMQAIVDNHGTFGDTEFLDERRVIIHCTMPMRNIITKFYDKVKTISSGYASYSYHFSHYETEDIIRLDIVLADDAVPALATLIPRGDAEKFGREIVGRLTKILPRQQFVIKIQAAIGGKIIAAERLSALRKDVTAKLYGGDVTRKRKLLEKQKKGKKKMASFGSVTIPQKTYIELLRFD